MQATPALCQLFSFNTQKALQNAGGLCILKAIGIHVKNCWGSLGLICSDEEFIRWMSLRRNANRDISWNCYVFITQCNDKDKQGCVSMIEGEIEGKR